MKRILSLMFITSSMFSMQLDTLKSDNKSQKRHINPAHVFTPEKLGALEVYHSKKGFTVKKDNEKHVIKKCFTDKMVRDITKKQLKSFLDAGYISINQMNDGEYSLQAKGRINGGGPLLGTFAYWVTKSVCYGVGIAATGAIAVGTAGTGVALVTGGAAVAGGGAVVGTIGTTTAIATTAGVVTGGATTAAAIGSTAGIVAGGLATAGLTGEAAVVTAGVVTSAGGIGATIAGIEALSVAVGSFFGMLPTL